MTFRYCSSWLALLPCIAADRAGLRRVETEPVLRRELWLLSHRDTGHVARFTAITEWLQRHFEAEALALRGDAGHDGSEAGVPR